MPTHIKGEYPEIYPIGNRVRIPNRPAAVSFVHDCAIESLAKSREGGTRESEASQNTCRYLDLQPGTAIPGRKPIGVIMLPRIEAGRAICNCGYQSTHMPFWLCSFHAGILAYSFQALFMVFPRYMMASRQCEPSIITMRVHHLLNIKP